MCAGSHHEGQQIVGICYLSHLGAADSKRLTVACEQRARRFTPRARRPTAEAGLPPASALK
jgi:hypothetical protein